MEELKPQANGVGETGPAQTETKVEPEAKSQEDQELEKKRAELQAIEDAKAQALEELQKIRSDKRQAKKEVKAEQPKQPENDEELEIDRNDPSAKAWIKEINQSVTPVQQELEKEKAEVRQYALDRFLAARPALAKNPAKLKELMAVYDRIRTSSERTQEGVTLDLEKAYAATFHKELLDAARQQRIDNVKQDAIFSDIAVSRGATTYPNPTPQKRTYTEEEKLILQRWEQSGAPKVDE